MAERIVLDPAEVATSRTALDISDWIAEEGIDWGDAEIQTYMADQARGAAPVDFRVPNRTITVPLSIKPMGGTSFATARTNIQAKASLFQRERGWLKRVAASGSVVFADVVNATLKLGGGWGQAHRGYDMDAQLVLEAQPDFYGAEVTLSDHVNPSGNPELIFTETQIQGDYPARVRIVVDEDDAERELGLLWGLRSRTYSSSATARLAYVAGTLTPQDTAAVATVTRIRHTTVSTVWTPLLSTDIIPTGPLTHTGTYRVWALMQGNDATDKTVDVRLLWDVGDLASPVENDPVRIPGPANSYALDLGEVRLDAAPSGTHRWRGQIQVKAETAPADVEASRVWIVPVDEGYGVLRAPITGAESFGSYRVRDGFDQTAGTLNAKTVAVGGGTWATVANLSAATDFSTTGSGELFRTPNSSQFYRSAIAGTAVMANTVVQMDVKWSTVPPVGSGLTTAFILMARQTTVDNFAGLYIDPTTGLVFVGRWTLFSAGSSSPSAIGTHGALQTKTLGANTWYTARMQVFDNGFVAGWYGLQGAPFGAPLVTGRHSDFATGGALDDGKVGFADLNPYTSTVTHSFDNFGAYAANVDAVMHPSQSAELRWDGNYREDAAGAGWGPVPFVTGDNPRLPPAGLEGRTCEVFIRSSRGDYDQLPDNDFDAFSARLFYRPCWLFVS